MKRFYREVTVAPECGGWRVLLDGRGIRTAGKRDQIVPGRALAEAMAAEWSAQGETLDPKTFQLRDLADFAIDAVSESVPDTVREILPYAETDTLCYRADPDEPLHKRQLEIWEPLLAAAEWQHDLRFTRVSGIIHKPQPAETLAALEKLLLGKTAFELAALKMLSSLAASLVLGLAALEPGADADALWTAANLEEDWQVELWGEDYEAQERRLARFEAFKLAMQFAALSRTG